MAGRWAHVDHRLGLSAGRPAPRQPVAAAPRGGRGSPARRAQLILLGVVGWSGSGKTTLIEAVLPILRRRGLSVSTIKHTHHDLDLDQPGKDSFRHRQAGATEVMVVSGRRWALMREAAEPDLAVLAARLAKVDLVLVEGFKSYAFPKLEVFRPALGRPPLWPELAGTCAVAAPAFVPACPLPRLPLDDGEAIAAWIHGSLNAGGFGGGGFAPPNLP